MKIWKVSKEGATVTNFMNTVSWVKYEQKKGEHAVKPGMNNSWQKQILHRHHCSQFATIYEKKIEIKMKKKKNRNKEQSVPVHLQRVPVHLCKKGTVAKVYRYTLQVYRYTLREKRQWPKCTGTPLTCTGTCGRVLSR